MKNNNNIVNVTRRPSNMWQTQVTRNNVSRSKRFSDSKYKGAGKALDAALAYGAYLQGISWTRFAAPAKAINKAKDYVHFLKTCSEYQFENAIRRPGRPTMSEFFGRRLIKN